MKEYLIEIHSPFYPPDGHRKVLLSYRLKVSEETIEVIIELIRHRLLSGELFLVSEIEIKEQQHLIHSTTNI